MYPIPFFDLPLGKALNSRPGKSFDRNFLGE